MAPDENVLRPRIGTSVRAAAILCYLYSFSFWIPPLLNIRDRGREEREGQTEEKEGTEEIRAILSNANTRS